MNQADFDEGADKHWEKRFIAIFISTISTLDYGVGVRWFVFYVLVPDGQAFTSSSKTLVFSEFGLGIIYMESFIFYNTFRFTQEYLLYINGSVGHIKQINPELKYQI